MVWKALGIPNPSSSCERPKLRPARGEEQAPSSPLGRVLLAPQRWWSAARGYPWFVSGPKWPYRAPYWPHGDASMHALLSSRRQGDLRSGRGRRTGSWSRVQREGLRGKATKKRANKVLAEGSLGGAGLAGGRCQLPSSASTVRIIAPSLLAALFRERRSGGHCRIHVAGRERG